jgi:hypothetical protein
LGGQRGGGVLGVSENLPHKLEKIIFYDIDSKFRE